MAQMRDNPEMAIAPLILGERLKSFFVKKSSRRWCHCMVSQSGTSATCVLESWAFASSFLMYFSSRAQRLGRSEFMSAFKVVFAEGGNAEGGNAM